MSKRSVTREELAQPLLPYEDARRLLAGAFEPLPPARTPVSAAIGRYLAEPVVADLDVPGFDNSAMDGYAIVAADTAGAADAPVTLRLIDDVPAGAAATVRVEPGTAAKIMTGAIIPDGADAVVPWEDTSPGDAGATVIVRARLDERRNIRPAGEDVAAGSRLAEAGERITPVLAGVIASQGRAHVLAHPQPRVAVLSTGDELVPPGGRLAGSQLFDSNRTLIAAMCEQAGARIERDALLPDDPDAIGAWLHEAAAAADLIVTSGGASVGEHDWIRAILEKEGSIAMWRIAIKPGKPIALGSIGAARVLALPGNPGSAFVGLHAFVQPAIRILGGASSPWPGALRARLTVDVKGSPQRTQFTRVVLRSGEDGSLEAEPLPMQSSLVLSNLLPANAMAIVPPGGAGAGSVVNVEPIR